MWGRGIVRNLLKTTDVNELVISDANLAEEIRYKAPRPDVAKWHMDS